MHAFCVRVLTREAHTILATARSHKKPLQGMVESMQQSSATPKKRDVGRGLRKIVACSQPYLAVASCIYSFWHGVIPTSYFYTCFTHFSLTVNISTNRGLPSPSTDGVYLDIYPDIVRAHPIYAHALALSAKIRMREMELLTRKMASHIAETSGSHKVAF